MQIAPPVPAEKNDFPLVGANREKPAKGTHKKE